jgi:hypothetical protein
MLMWNARQTRRWYLRKRDKPRANLADVPHDRIEACELVAQGDQLSATVRLVDNCRFSDDTREADANRRLHRAFSDCIEVESIDPGAFSYAIDVATGSDS